MKEKLNPMEERKLTEEAYARLRLWRDGCREAHERAREARSILLLKDPEQDAGRREGEKPTLQLQTLKSTFNSCVADQMDNLPEAVLLPETPQLQSVAEDLTDVVRYVLEQNRFESLHRRRVEDCFCTGTAVTQITWDADLDGGRGNVALIRWPVEAFLWDPAAEDLQDARAVFKVSRHPLSWFRERYPDKADAIGTDDVTFSDLGVNGTEDALLAGGDEERALLVEYWYRRYDAKTRRYTVSCATLAGGTLLRHYPDVFRHGMYPFVLDVHTPLEGTPVGEGLVGELAPLMRYVNRYAAYIDMNLRMSSKGRLLVDRGAGIDKAQLTDWESDVVEGDRIDPGAVKWLQSQPYTGLAAQQLLQFQSDIKQDSGQNQFTRGEPVGGVTAASAISALQEAGGKITRLRTSALNEGFRAIVTQILWLIAQFYDSRRVVYITGRGTAPREVPAGPGRLFGAKPGGAVPPPPYTVQVQVQRRNPLRVQAQNELLLQAFDLCARAGSPMPVSLLFDLLQADGKEAVLPALRAAETLPLQTRAAQAEAADLRALCEEAGGLMDASRREAEAAQSAIAKLLEEREELLARLDALTKQRRIKVSEAEG